jgi:hypothetical protein
MFLGSSPRNLASLRECETARRQWTFLRHARSRQDCTAQFQRAERGLAEIKLSENV